MPTTVRSATSKKAIRFMHGYRDWRWISSAHEEGNLHSLGAVLGNDLAINAYHEGKLPFPDGTIIAALHYRHVPSDENNKVFGQAQSFVPGSPTNVQFMVKDSTKYAATGGGRFGHFADGKPGDAAFIKLFPLPREGRRDRPCLYSVRAVMLETNGKEHPMKYPTLYRTAQIDGLSIFYRESGPKDAPTILLLHGLPSSSRMFEPLFTRLSDRYHLVAPDYPGFGHSDWPDPKKFAYTFDHIAEVMNHFTEALGLSHFTLYMQDYGGPVGFRMILAHPDRVEALIVQDAVAHNTGLGENWKTRRAFWNDRAANESALRANLLSLAATKARHAGNDPNVERHNPDLWIDEFYFINQPGQADIQSDLFYDYRTNVDSYPKWQAWMREKQPRLLVIWGRYESSFDLSEPESYRRDVPKAEVHIVDGGHFALDTAADEIAALVQGFVGSSRQGSAARFLQL